MLEFFRSLTIARAVPAPDGWMLEFEDGTAARVIYSVKHVGDQEVDFKRIIPCD